MATPSVKKNSNALYMKGCVGCLAIVFIVVCVIAAGGGYLFYKEETGLDDHSDEVQTIKILNNAAVVTLTPSGRGSAQYNVWVRGPGLTEAIGTHTCNYTARPFGRKRHYRSKTDGPHKHIWIWKMHLYSRSNPETCKLNFTSLKGKGPFEVVVTRSSRPSDWL